MSTCQTITKTGSGQALVLHQAQASMGEVEIHIYGIHCWLCAESRNLFVENRHGFFKPVHQQSQQGTTARHSGGMHEALHCTQRSSAWHVLALLQCGAACPAATFTCTSRPLHQE